MAEDSTLHRLLVDVEIAKERREARQTELATVMATHAQAVRNAQNAATVADTNFTQASSKLKDALGKRGLLG